jgi:hypothetical protein
MPSPAALEAIILAVDPAKHTSGAVILIPDYGNGMLGEVEHPFEGNYVLHEFGKVQTQEERERFVNSLVDTVLEMRLPPVVVAEEWDPPRNKRLRLPGGVPGLLMDPKWTYQTILGIGEGWGRWAAEIESASSYLKDDEGLPPIPVVRVTPNDWRDGLFPRPRAKESAALKETAIRIFESVFGYKASDDISEAGCIGLWATTAPQVAAAADAWEAAREAAPAPKKRARKKT